MKRRTEGIALGSPKAFNYEEVERLERELAALRSEKEALETEGAKLRLAVDQLPAIVWTTDCELRITSALGAGVSALGVQPGKRIGWTLRELLGGADASYPPIAAARRAIAGETSDFILGWNSRQFHTYISPLRGPSGRIIGTLGVALDITEQQHADEALRISQARISGIIAISEDAIISVDREQRITLFNPGAERIFGYAADEVLGQTLDILLPERSAATHHTYVRSFAASADALRPMNERGEIFGRRKDGSEFPAEASISKFEVAGETTLNVRMRDITERKRAEDELKARAEQQEAVALIGQQALRGGDLSALMQQSCALVARTLGVHFCKVLELLAGGQLLLRAGVGWKEGLVGKRRVSAGRGSHGGFALASTEPVIMQDLSRETRFDEPLLREHEVVSGLAVIIHTQAGPFGVLGAHADRRRQFTRDDINFVQAVANVLGSAIERNRTEQALRQSNETLRVVNQATPLAIWGLDLEGQVRLWNPAAERLFGWTQEEVLGRPSLIIPEAQQEAYRQMLARFRRGETLAGEETERQKKNGTALDVSLWTAPLRDAFGLIDGTLVVAVDITERKRMEDQLRQSQKLESIGLLAGGIAHDFNNLLTGIMGNVSLALDLVRRGDGARELLENSLRASERAAELVRQLLAYAGKGRFVVQPVNLSSLVKELVRLLQTSVPKKVELKLDLQPDVPAVEADPAQMQQLIMNLVINGAEAIGERAGTVTIRTRAVEAGPDPWYGTFNVDLPSGPYVCLQVNDTGCGMDEQTQAQIFDPFFTTKFTGRGLGLSAVSGIVRGHRGAVRVSSEPGRGSTFEVLLPASDRQRAHPGQQAGGRELAGRGTILVVDDEEVVRQTARSALSRYGYGVLEAADGSQAIELFRRDPAAIALVLLDMSMPVMSGEETLLQLVNIRPEVRVIVSSGYNEVEAIRHFTGAGVAAFIQKPYTAAALAEKIKAVLV